MPEIVAGIGIAHYKVGSDRRRDSSHESVSVSLGGDWDNSRTQPLSDLNGAITAAVVGNDDFPLYTFGEHRLLCLADTGLQRFRFVQTGQHHGEFDLLWIALTRGSLLRFETGSGRHSKSLRYSRNSSITRRSIFCRLFPLGRKKIGNPMEFTKQARGERGEPLVCCDVGADAVGCLDCPPGR